MHVCLCMYVWTYNWLIMGFYRYKFQVLWGDSVLWGWYCGVMELCVYFVLHGTWNPLAPLFASPHNNDIRILNIHVYVFDAVAKRPLPGIHLNYTPSHSTCILYIQNPPHDTTYPRPHKTPYTGTHNKQCRLQHFYFERFIQNYIWYQLLFLS